MTDGTGGGGAGALPVVGGGEEGPPLSAAAVRQITEAVAAAIVGRTPAPLAATVEEDHITPRDGEGVGLRVDPSLGVDATPLLPDLTSGGLEGESDTTPRSSAVVTEGLPPLPVKILEKIRRWEFVDLSLLLHDSTWKAEDSLMKQQSAEGVLIFQSIEQAQRRRKVVGDIFTWCKAFSIYAAALSGADSTSSMECMGLWAHLHLINQLSRDMGGGQWLQYDIEFREWAAAKGIRMWGELNLSIYGRCLSHRLAYSISNSMSSNSVASQGRRRTAGKRSNVCYPWNFEGVCDRANKGGCAFTHMCYYCGSTHKAMDCQEKKHRKELK